MMFSEDHLASQAVERMTQPDQTHPLTEAQEGLWYAQRLDPLNPIFNTAHCTDFIGEFDLDLLCRAINQTLDEADALSLRMVETEDGPLQYFDGSHRPSLQVIDLRAHDNGHDLAGQAMRTDHLSPIDPTHDPLSAQQLFLLSDTHCQWYQRVHHLAADGYGMSLIENRATYLYENWRKGSVTHAKPLTSFSEVLLDDQRYRHSEARARSQSHWLAALADMGDVASLSASAALTAHTRLQASASVDDSTLKLLQAAERQYGCSWPDILTALSAAYTQRHTGQSDVIVGMPWMGRMGSISARAVATVMNIAPLLLHINQRGTIGDFLKDSTKRIGLARRHGRYRSEQLRRDLGLLGGLRRLYGPLVNILPFDAPYDLEGLDARQRVLCAGPVEDLNINFRSAPDATGLRLELEANPKLYSQNEVEAHLERLLSFLRSALRANRLSAVPSLTPNEHLQWVRDCNQTDQPISDLSLGELVTQQCIDFSDHTALVFKDQSLSFAQFSAKIQNIANHLAAMGVGRGDIVAVALERSDEMIMCLHGIIASGAAYLPIDIAQPAERAERILGGAGPKAIIYHGGKPRLQTVNIQHLDVRQLFDTQAQPQVIRPAKPQDPAYVLYTSGSTGDPKGVVVSHRAIVNRLLWMKAQYQLDHNARFLQKTPYTFDVSLWELFLPMLCGAPLVVAEPEQHKDPYALLQLIKAEQINVVHFVPSMLNAFLNEALSEGLSIPYVFCSGEALSLHLCQRFYSRIKGQLHNLYGPTEAAVDVSYWHVPENDISDPVPIGRPVWNTQLYILDEFLRPVPPGVAGTLYIGGVQLAEGYLGRTDLTAQQFILSPFSKDPASRLYNTGDLARWRNDGAVVYLGRADHQIKLRGQRIELGEIESCLAKCPALRDVVVVARADQPGELYIAAYVVARTANERPTDTVLAYAREHLPEAMVPSALVWLEALPTSANGKLDRKALPAPQRESHSGKALKGETQHQVAMLYQELLRLEKQPYASDDFFALGGHSLLAAQLISKLRESTGLALSLGAIFENPSIERLANYLDQATSALGAHDTTGFNVLLTLRPAVSPAYLNEPALFCIHPAGGLSWCYGLLARELEGSRPVYGLQSRSLHADQHPRPACTKWQSTTPIKSKPCKSMALTICWAGQSAALSSMKSHRY